MGQLAGASGNRGVLAVSCAVGIPYPGETRSNKYSDTFVQILQMGVGSLVRYLLLLDSLLPWKKKHFKSTVPAKTKETRNKTETKNKLANPNEPRISLR